MPPFAITVFCYLSKGKEVILFDAYYSTRISTVKVRVLILVNKL